MPPAVPGPRTLRVGEAIPLTDLASDPFDFRIGLYGASYTPPLVGLLLDGDGLAASSASLAYEGNEASPDGALVYEGQDHGSSWMRLRVSSLAPEVRRVVIGSWRAGSAEDSADALTVFLLGPDGEVSAVGNCRAEAGHGATLMIEIYLRGDQWRCRLLGDGYEGGLARMLEVHGFDPRILIVPSLPSAPTTPSSDFVAVQPAMKSQTAENSRDASPVTASTKLPTIERPMEAHPSDPAVIADRCHRLVRFLYDLAQSQVATVTDIEQHPVRLWLSELPAAFALDPVRGLDIGPGSTVLTVPPVALEPPPEPPSILAKWVSVADRDNSGLDEPPLRPRGPVITIEQSPDGESMQITTEVPIEEAPAVRRAYQDWLPEWRAWAEIDRVNAAERRVYDELYTAHQRLSQEGDALEFVLATGLLLYETPEQIKVRHPLLTTRLTIEVDKQTAAIVVRIDEEARTRLEDGALLQGSSDFYAERTNALHEELQNREPQPLAEPDQALLSTWLERGLGVADGFSPDWHPQRGIATAAKIAFAPALLLRARGRNALLNYYDEMLKVLARDGEAPLGLAQLVTTLEPAQRLAWLDGQSATSAEVLGSDPLFPLPANPEQAQIMGRLRGDNGVVVEGPPGTGKTHTIANLVAALLAQGQRVLVTSQKAQALRVLRDKLPPDLQRLCVSLTDVGRGGSPELAASIAALAAEKSSYNPAERALKIERARDMRGQAMAQRSRAIEDMRALRESETFQHPEIAPGYAGTLASIAARVRDGADLHSWMPLPISEPAALSTSEAYELLQLLRSETPARVSRTSQDLPDLAEFPSAHDVRRQIEDERASSETAAAAASALSSALGYLDMGEFGEVEQAFDELDSIASTLREALADSSESWIKRAIDDGFAHRDQALWEVLFDASPLAKTASDCLAAVGVRSVTLPVTSQSADALLVAATNLRAYLVAGGQLKRMFKSDVQKAAEPILEGGAIDGVPIATAAQLDIVCAYLKAESASAAVSRQWQFVGVDLPGGLPLPTRVSRLRDLHRQLDLIRGLLASRSAVAQALDRRRVRDVPLRSLDDCEALGNALANARLQLKALAATADLDRLTESLEQTARLTAAPPEVDEITKALRGRDADAYARSLAALAAAAPEQVEQQRCNELRTRLHKTHPALAALLERTRDDAVWDARTSSLPAAWAWGQARTFFDEQRRPGREQRLQGELASAEAAVGQATGQLATELAWQACLQRMTASQVAALQSYRSAVDARGMGTGRYAAKYARAARDAMRDAQGAVPAWIMPLPDVLSTIPAVRDSFDVVIVDEASQASLESLFLLWLAPRVIVVGDDKQCTPPEVAMGSLEPIFNRLDDLLPDLPSYLRVSFTPRSSLFSILRARFGQVVRLREHFRCMPEIIEWSSSMFYRDQPLIPLRQFGTDRLEPIRTTFVSGAYNEGKSSTLRNQVEAEALVDQVIACSEDRTYDDKTFGIVVLQGNAQVDVIRNALLRRMSHEEHERRHLRIGTPPDFQGDERHVIFLSMVLAPDARTTSLTKLEYQRRFNVAASRAQDQVWLFHSVSVDKLNPSDLRHSYLSYLMARPSGDIDDGLSAVRRDVPTPPFDSMFEQKVFLDIRARGYRVTPQVEVNGRRIDLVVVGGSAKLAVECDGDAWHSSQDQIAADLARERELMRAGWVFWRVRQSEYDFDNADALSTLWTTLESRGIAPFPPATPRTGSNDVAGPPVSWAPQPLSREDGLDDLDEPAA